MTTTPRQQELLERASEEAERGHEETAAELEHMGTSHRNSQREVIEDEDEEQDDESEQTGDHVPPENGIAMSTYTPLDVSWLWKGRLPLGKFVILAGKRGSKKSYWTLDMITRVVKGSPMPDGTPGVQGPVILISPEDDPESTIVPRLIAQGCTDDDLMQIYNMSEVKRNNKGTGRINESTFKLPDDLGLLRAMIDRYKPAMCVLDPFMRIVAAHVSTARNQTVSEEILEPLQKVAQDTGCCIIMVCHFNKGMNYKNLIENVGGSGGIIDYARFVYGIVPTPEDPSMMTFMCLKNSLAEEPPNMTFYINKKGRVVYDSGMAAEHLDAFQKRSLSDARQKILTVLESDARVWHSYEICQSSGIKSTNRYNYVRTLLTRMKQAEQIASTKRDHYCTLAYWQALQAAKNANTATSTPNANTVATVTSVTIDSNGKQEAGPASLETVVLAPSSSVQPASS